MTEEIPIFQFAIREDLLSLTGFSILPKKAEKYATGWDCRAFPHASETNNKSQIIVRPGTYVKIPLGFRCFAPEGWWLQLHPRSSSFIKKHMNCLVGTIDETYDQEIALCFQYLPDLNSMGKDLVISFGDAIGQLLPVKRVEMKTELVSNNKFDELCQLRNAPRKGGFGSTDNKGK